MRYNTAKTPAAMISATPEPDNRDARLSAKNQRNDSRKRRENEDL
jgi:hypothetical protein